MDKICQNCGQLNPPNALFCRSCAAALPPNNQPASGNQGQYQNRQANQPPNQQWNPPNLGNQMGGNTAPIADTASGRAYTAAGLAVAGLFCCGVFSGIPAVLVGWLELTAIKEGRSSSKGMIFAQIGFWGGIAGSIITTFIWFVLMLLSGRG